MGDLPTVIEQRAVMPVVNVATAIARRQQLVALVKSEAWVPGVDSGVIPGTEKETLLQPGAQKLGFFFGLSPKFEVVEKVEDWTGKDHNGEAFFYFKYRCLLYQGDFFVAEALGSANSMEPRYRYRWVAAHEVPRDLDKSVLTRQVGKVEEFDFAIQKGETSGQYGKPQEYWDEFRAAIKDGRAISFEGTSRSGQTFPKWKIETALYRIPNPDIAGLVNTIDKISQKRAYVSCVITATSGSEFFTPDLEDMDLSTIEGTVISSSKVAPKATVEPAPKSKETKKQETATSQEWDWNALFLPLAKVGLQQGDVLKELGVKAVPDLKKNFPWAAILTARDIILRARARALTMDQVHEVLGLPSVMAFDGTPDDADTLFSDFADYNTAEVEPIGQGETEEDIPFDQEAVIAKADKIIEGIHQSVTFYDSKGWGASDGQRKALLGVVSNLMPGQTQEDRDNSRHLFTQEVYGKEHWEELTGAEVLALGKWAQDKQEDGKYVVKDNALGDAACILNAWGVKQGQQALF